MDFNERLGHYEHDAEGADASLAFFDLANSAEITYQVTSTLKLLIRQDVAACGRHTGGIVWETAFLLEQYLSSFFLDEYSAKSSKKTPYPLGSLLEVGAGCGLLGQALAVKQLCRECVLTETTLVLDNLRVNVELNRAVTSKGQVPIHVCRLDWKECEQDTKLAGLAPHSFDTIVGTDVVFSPSLVEPLLETLRYMSHPRTIIYLCVQIRCPTSHELLLEKLPHFGFHVENLESDLSSLPSCKWGVELECHLLRLHSINSESQGS